MGEFAKTLNITPAYLRKVCKRSHLQIKGYTDPHNKSRKLLSTAEQERIRAELNRNTTPQHNTATPQLGTETVYNGELVLYNDTPRPMDAALAIREQSQAELAEIEQSLAQQFATFDRGLDALCAGIEEQVAQKVVRAGANGISRGMNTLNGQVSTVGKPPVPGATGG